MGNSLRCCLACVLPCGALDMVRVVHLSGRVDEYARPVAAGEVLAAHPNHVLSRPCSQGAVVRRILIVSPDSELERGGIYFLIPAASVPDRKKKPPPPPPPGRHDRGQKKGHARTASQPAADEEEAAVAPGVVPEKKAAHRRRRSSGGRAAVWRPHLECIIEDT